MKFSLEKKNSLVQIKKGLTSKIITIEKVNKEYSAHVTQIIMQSKMQYFQEAQFVLKEKMKVYATMTMCKLSMQKIFLSNGPAIRNDQI